MGDVQAREVVAIGASAGRRGGSDEPGRLSPLCGVNGTIERVILEMEGRAREA